MSILRTNRLLACPGRGGAAMNTAYDDTIASSDAAMPIEARAW
jgi:hypothetical protein